ncbi:hypothetical protein [Fusobacterium perfoetens]|uniref:hypothetical protein n=1 Tax=Fusobacterium perfoetens TaxID=852 RepID=UPI00048086E6|nr:hypothetical protein [Fusobacterium perfoetens]MCI6152118.1 hypothetical protein [Fusobacterium perfoetens]MDY3237991.1 hypothetical protein [Fusobacterium perfoetens]
MIKKAIIILFMLIMNFSYSETTKSNTGNKILVLNNIFLSYDGSDKSTYGHNRFTSFNEAKESFESALANIKKRADERKDPNFEIIYQDIEDTFGMSISKETFDENKTKIKYIFLYWNRSYLSLFTFTNKIQGKNLLEFLKSNIYLNYIEERKIDKLFKKYYKSFIN